MDIPLQTKKHCMYFVQMCYTQETFIGLLNFKQLIVNTFEGLSDKYLVVSSNVFLSHLIRSVVFPISNNF